MLSEAQEANDLYKEMEQLGEVDFYDSCGGLESDFGADYTSNWLMILEMNSYYYLGSVCLLVLVFFGQCCSAIFCLGCLGMCCGGPVHLAVIIVTGIYRF